MDFECVESKEKSFLNVRFFYGGWCPHLTTLKDCEEFPKKICINDNFADVCEDKEEKVTIDIAFDNKGFIQQIICGIPEKMFVHADVKWHDKGIFVLKIVFSVDILKENNIGSTISKNDRELISHNIIYKLIKRYHHSHTHHEAEKDGLLDLFYFGKNQSKSPLSSEEIREKIIKCFYKQYSQVKPNEYTKNIINLIKMVALSLKPDQLEETIKIIIQGIGEMAYGMAFLSMHGRIIFTEPKMYSEMMKFQSVITSLEAQKDTYTFQYMKDRKQELNTQTVITSVTDGITQGTIKSIKGI